VAEQVELHPYWQELLTIHAHSDAPPNFKIPQLRRLLEQVCRAESEGDAVYLSNLHALIVWQGQKLKLPRPQVRALHGLRIKANSILHGGITATEEDYRESVLALAELLVRIVMQLVPAEVTAYLQRKPEAVPAPQPAPTYTRYPPAFRAYFESYDADTQMLIVLPESSEEPFAVHISAGFQAEVIGRWMAKNLRQGDTLMLVGLYRKDDMPRALHIVYEPDFLVDVTAVAECVQSSGDFAGRHLLNQLLPTRATPEMTLGNLANLLFDIAISHAQMEPLSPKEYLGMLFRASPLDFIGGDDDDYASSRDSFLQKLKSQFTLLNSTVRHTLTNPAIGIQPEQMLVEPSFLAVDYGLQGRLDALHRSVDGKNMKIIELKSSKSVPKSGSQKPTAPSDAVWKNHAAQAELYHLLLEAMQGHVSGIHYQSFILYSQADSEPLRPIFPTQTKQRELVHLRNQLVLAERQLMTDFDSASQAIQGLFTSASDLRLPPFVRESIVKLEALFTSLTPLERKYYISFVQFTAREKWLAKLGTGERNPGHAALWRNTPEEQQEAYEMLADLQLVPTDDDRVQPTEGGLLAFLRSQTGDSHVNFRTGEAVILYEKPANGPYDITRSIILKGMVTALDAEHVYLYFRHPQQVRYIREHAVSRWALQHDFMESGLSNQYKQLFTFFSTLAPNRRRILLGMDAPAGEGSSTVGTPEEVVESAFACQDYYLIVGPPGTGKTHRVLAPLVRRLFDEPKERILVLAYTNRAVDEIHEALLEQLPALQPSLQTPLLRIGSRYATQEDLRPWLLSSLAAKAEKRQDLLVLLSGVRILLGTVASIQGQQVLFEKMKFTTAVVDEASQLLEPQIIGLLAKVGRFILIGDPRQLPAVVAQDPAQSRTNDPELEAIGLVDRRNSYFERLYGRCMANGWHHAIGQLFLQGRMHRELAAFPSKAYYHERPLSLALPERQSAPLPEPAHPPNTELAQLVANRRQAFLHIPADPRATAATKTSLAEAQRIVDLLLALQHVRGTDYDLTTRVGIITPWRNQIATIRAALRASSLSADVANGLTIDTVERYQGSARDVILLSACIQSPLQLRQLVSLSQDGIDRKLNVALTRAREQLFLLGDETLLSQDAGYRTWIEWVGGGLD
jgi:DNA replication ATP-dependent helicase Dna2